MITVRDICEELHEHWLKYQAGPDRDDLFNDETTWGDAVTAAIHRAESVLGNVPEAGTHD